MEFKELGRQMFQVGVAWVQGRGSTVRLSPCLLACLPACLPAAHAHNPPLPAHTHTITISPHPPPLLSVQRFVEDCGEDTAVESQPAMQGRQMNMVLAPKKI